MVVGVTFPDSATALCVTPVPPRDRPCRDGPLLLAWIGLILDQDVHTLR